MENSIVVVSPVAVAVESELDTKRHEVVSDIMRGYGATKNYAELIAKWFVFNWFEFEFNDKSPEAQPILEEGKKFRAELKAAGHTNPSVAWTRVRQEGKKLADAQLGIAPDADTESEGAGAKVVRGLTLRLVEDLTTLHKACKREADKNNLDAKQTEAHTLICSALAALGVDLNMVK